MTLKALKATAKASLEVENIVPNLVTEFTIVVTKWADAISPQASAR